MKNPSLRRRLIWKKILSEKIPKKIQVWKKSTSLRKELKECSVWEKNASPSKDLSKKKNLSEKYLIKKKRWVPEKTKTEKIEVWNKIISLKKVSWKNSKSEEIQS